MVFLTADDRTALLWSTGAGLATALGGMLAIIRRPEAALLAFLLGTAIGVMSTLSVLELLIYNALENGVWQVCGCAAAGGLFYVVVEPLLPHFESSVVAAGAAAKEAEAGPTRAEDVTPSSPTILPRKPATDGDAPIDGDALTPATAGRITRQKSRQAAEAARAASAVVAAEAMRTEAARKDNLLRLGFLMAVTMTLHNLVRVRRSAGRVQRRLTPGR